MQGLAWVATTMSQPTGGLISIFTAQYPSAYLSAIRVTTATASTQRICFLALREKTRLTWSPKAGTGANKKRSAFAHMRLLLRIRYIMHLAPANAGNANARGLLTTKTKETNLNALVGQGCACCLSRERGPGHGQGTNGPAAGQGLPATGYPSLHKSLWLPLIPPHDC